MTFWPVLVLASCATADDVSPPTHPLSLQENLFEWHFTIQGPQGTPFEKGRYHGRILLPSEYPMKPPNIILMTVSQDHTPCAPTPPEIL